MKTPSEARQEIERFLAMRGGSFALLLDMVGGAQPPEMPMVMSSQTLERRSLAPASVKADSDNNGR